MDNPLSYLDTALERLKLFAAHILADFGIALSNAATVREGLGLVFV